MCEIELGFKETEIQHIVIAVPKVLTANKRKLTQIFDFLHNTMKVPHHLIAKFPQVDLLLIFVVIYLFTSLGPLWTYFHMYFVHLQGYNLTIWYMLPQVLNTKYLRIRERHMFLDYLGKAQYDPTLPNYISLDRLVSLPDETFCMTLALATLEDFYLFQKTLWFFIRGH